MARVPDDEIERLKKDVSVERLAEARGIQLRRHGGNLLGLCPFHEDREPSLVITPEKNLWHCMGACQAGGSAIDWVMRTEGVSFRLAVELLRNDVPALSSPSEATAKRPPKQASTVKLPPLASLDASDEALLVRVANYYHATLKESPEAMAYLEGRGIGSAEAVERFRIGYANRTLGYRLPQKNRVAGEEIRGRLAKLGVLRESGHEHLSGSIVIPIFDATGTKVLGMYGRKSTANLRPGTALHLYLPGPHRGVWNEAGLSAEVGDGEVILCEALIDALTFWSAGYRNVTASYGVEGFTEAHVAMLERTKTRVVRIAYDRDEAGDRAAEALSKKLNAQGIETYRVLFPKGMDANEYARKVGPATKSLGIVLRNAEWMGKGVRPVAVDAPAAASAIEASGMEVAEHEGEEAHEGLPSFAAVSVSSSSEVSTESEASASESSAREMSAAMPMNAATTTARAETGGEHVSATAADDGRDVFPSFVALSRASSSSPHHESTASVPTERPVPRPSTSTSAKRDELVFVFGDRRWRVRGLGKSLSFGQLRVNLGVSRAAGGFFVDTVDLYVAKHRASYTHQAAGELGVEEAIVKRDLGQVLLGLEQQQEEQIEATLKPKTVTVAMTETERDEALSLLRDVHLLGRIVADFEACGVVGEETNKLVGYLAAVSRKLAEPLAVVIQSSSAAGKSSLMDAVLAFVPEEERVSYSAMTGQSLYYMGEEDLRHKVLAVVEEAGAERASYALKLLQSEGELTIASTGKDPVTGKLVTQTYRVAGPVGLFLTTTAITVDEELLNRCIVLTVDEGKEQTRAIHERQREAQTLEGMLAKEERRRVRTLHQNAQRLLQSLLVVNPYARELSFADSRTRTRRDHMKYLTLIRTVALLHQHQREVKSVEHGGQVLRYIEATPEDIAVADRLAAAVLGRGLDELPPQTRRLYELVEGMVTERARAQGAPREMIRFTRREVREHAGWGHTQVKVHMQRLEELEYVLVHRGGRGQGHVYELGVSGDAGTTSKGSGWSGPGRPVVGGRSGSEADRLKSASTAPFIADREPRRRAVGVEGDHVVGRRANGAASYAEHAS